MCPGCVATTLLRSVLLQVLTAGAFERSHKVRNVLLQSREWLARVLIGRVATPAYQDLPLTVMTAGAQQLFHVKVLSALPISHSRRRPVR